jgi:hypothetical protein
MILHTGIATATKTPEIALDKEESDLLADAAANIMAEFDVTPDPKTQAIVAGIVACATVYGPRVVSIRMRKAAEKAASEESNRATVYNADGSFAGETTYTNSTEKDTETTFNDLDNIDIGAMPAGKAGT